MKSILILDAFITDEADENLLTNFIDSSRSIGDDILLMSNSKISKTTQDKVDYFFYDKRNQLFREEYDNYKLLSYYTVNSSFKVSNIFPHPQPHGLSVLINIFNSVKIAKNLGYTHFYKMEYDAILGDNTKNKIKEMNESCILNNKKGVFFRGKNGENSLEAHYFFCEIDFFLDNFWSISNEQDYIKYLDYETGNRDFVTMEEFMFKNLMKSNTDYVNIYENLSDLFSDTHLNSKHTKVYYDEKFNECFTKFYLIKNNPDKVVIYSVNKKIKEDSRKIIVIFTNGNQVEINQEFYCYNSWSYNVVDNNIEKMMIYDKDGLFLHEEYFKNIMNEIEFY
jgi:hypothetical protein